MKNIAFIFLPILFLNNSYSQTGPGGVGNTSSNGLWLKADDINQASNTNVVSWTDNSGNNNHANQTVSSSQPLYFRTSNLNNMPVVA
jgi:hypothetical protein